MNADYGDIGGPPLHPDCRCYLRPRTSKRNLDTLVRNAYPNPTAQFEARPLSILAVPQTSAL
jgi:hypothetical protein